MAPDLRAVRHRCEARLRTLELPEPLDLEALRAALACQRGRPLTLLPLASGSGPFGLWVASARGDYVFFAQETTPAHQRHIVLHELCHMLCGHRSAPVAESELVRLLLPDLPPGLIQTVLGRSAYTAAEEQEAELLASLILERTARPTPEGLGTPYAASTLLLGRLERTLGCLPEEQP